MSRIKKSVATGGLLWSLLAGLVLPSLVSVQPVRAEEPAAAAAPERPPMRRPLPRRRWRNRWRPSRAR
jgi:hypothetical protein